jgi:hypothetical protein
MALGSTQPLTDMSTRNLPGDKGWQVHKADNLTTICEPQRVTTLWASTACYRDSYINIIRRRTTTNIIIYTSIKVSQKRCTAVIIRKAEERLLMALQPCL